MSSRYGFDPDPLLLDDGDYPFAFDDNKRKGIPAVQDAFWPGYTLGYGHYEASNYGYVFDQPVPTGDTVLYENPNLPPNNYLSTAQPTNNDNVNYYIDPRRLPTSTPSTIDFQATAAQQIFPSIECPDKVEVSSAHDPHYQQPYPSSMGAEFQANLGPLLAGMLPYCQSDMSPILDALQGTNVAGEPLKHDRFLPFPLGQPEQEALYPSQDALYQMSNQRRAGTSVTPRARSTQIPSKLCSYLGCTRRFRPTGPDKELCRRHQDKYDRNNADPPIFRMLPEIHSFERALDRVYPRSPALNLPYDDIRSKTEDEWISEFIHAANTPYESGSEYDEFHSRQQKVYNGKGFDNLMVNVRMRFLYKAALTFHEGGNAVYPKGGDNEGYGNADKTLIFSERLNAIIGILALDKRVCMDVIEGRGVTALVANPLKYEKRKTQNKDSNARKQKKQKLGDKVQEKWKRQGKDHEGSDVDSEDVSSVEEAAEDEEEQHVAQNILTPAPTPSDQALNDDLDLVRANSGKQKRATGSSTARASDKKPAKRQRTSKED